MKETKRRFNRYSFFDFPAIERRLERMAADGWMIEKAEGNLWQYRRMEPRQLRFSIAFFPTATALDPEPSERQREFWELCEQAGWKLAAQTAQLQIFYNEQENPRPLESDPVVQVETIHRAAKRSLIPQWCVFVFLAVFQFVMILLRLNHDPIGLLAQATNSFTALCWVALLVIGVSQLTSYFLWYRRAKVAAGQHGEFLLPREPRLLQNICLLLVGIALLFWILSMLQSPALKYGIIGVVYMALVFLLVRTIMLTLKRRKVSPKINFTITMAASFALSFAMMGLLTMGVIKASSSGWMVDSDAAGTYEYEGNVWEYYDHDLPLTVEDMMEVQASEDAYSRRWRADESIFLGQFEATQRARFDSERAADLPDLEYTVTKVKLPSLYAFCKKHLLQERDEREDDRIPEGHKNFYESDDPTLWGAQEVYRLHAQDTGPRNRYLVCYEDKLIEIAFYGWEPTQEQIAIAGEKLSSL